MIVAEFIAGQRTMFGVPHTITCRALEVSQAWFYKWINHVAEWSLLQRYDFDEHKLAVYRTTVRTRTSRKATTYLISPYPYVLGYSAAAGDDEHADTHLRDLAAQPDLRQYLERLCEGPPTDEVTDFVAKNPADYCTQVLYDSDSTADHTADERIIVGAPLWIRRACSAWNT